MKKKILLIEDNLEMRENTSEILELASYDVMAVDNGKEGVMYAKENNPDLIICDIMMPKMDGYEVLYLISKDPKTASIPFIFLTAKVEQSDMREAMNLGADDYLTKPYERMDLLNAIEVRLKKSELMRVRFDGGKEELDEFINNAKSFESLSHLSDDRKTRTFNKKDIVFYENDFPNSLLFIVKGKIKAWKMNDNGKELITGLYNKGDFIGHVPLLEGGAYASTATAMEETEVAYIPKDDFTALVHNNRDVSGKFIKMIANNVQEMKERLLKLAYNSLREKVADALLRVKERFEEDEETDFSFNFSREDLASVAGTTPESLIRTLSEFKEEKLIEVTRSEVKLIDVPGIQRVSKRSF